MNYRTLFNEKKATHSAAFFLSKTSSKTLPVIKLMKLLYLAERKSYEIYGLPIIGDSPVSMNLGPVLSTTYDRIQGSGRPDSFWESWIADRENHDVSLRDASLVRDVNDLVALSESDVEVLSEIWETYGSREKFELCDFTHSFCTEWKDPSGSSHPINIITLLNAVGYNEEAAQVIKHNLQTQANINEAFSRGEYISAFEDGISEETSAAIAFHR